MSTSLRHRFIRGYALTKEARRQVLLLKPLDVRVKDWLGRQWHVKRDGTIDMRFYRMGVK